MRPGAGLRKHYRGGTQRGSGHAAGCWAPRLPGTELRARHRPQSPAPRACVVSTPSSAEPPRPDLRPPARAGRAGAPQGAVRLLAAASARPAPTPACPRALTRRGRCLLSSRWRRGPNPLNQTPNCAIRTLEPQTPGPGLPRGCLQVERPGGRAARGGVQTWARAEAGAGSGAWQGSIAAPMGSGRLAGRCQCPGPSRSFIYSWMHSLTGNMQELEGAEGGRQKDDPPPTALCLSRADSDLEPVLFRLDLTCRCRQSVTCPGQGRESPLGFSPRTTQQVPFLPLFSSCLH